jgi:hypothetical protein
MAPKAEDTVAASTSEKEEKKDKKLTGIKIFLSLIYMLKGLIG